jgi:ParG
MARKVSTPMPKQPTEKRIVVKVTPELHTRIKLDCVAKQQNIADVVRAMLIERWPPARRTAA